VSEITPYRLTLLTAILCLCILGAVAGAVILMVPGGNPQNAALIFGFLAPTIGALVAVYRSEQNAAAIQRNVQTTQQLHEQNQASIAAVNQKIDGLQGASAAAGAAAALTAAQQLGAVVPEAHVPEATG
jgi:hypothetical protein